MNGIQRRITKLEQQFRPNANVWEPRMVKVTLRQFAREVVAGTRRPENATEEVALTELRGFPATVGASLAERMEAAISHGKTRREQGGTAQ